MRAESMPTKESAGCSLEPANDLEILEAIHSQVERMGMEDREPMSPVERKLGNAILVLLNVLIAERRPQPGEYVRVPKTALEWLFGEVGSFERPEGSGAYWWRSEFRKRAGL